MTKFDTWLSDSDLERLWKVTHGELPLSFASSDEMNEFFNVVNQAGMQKIAGKEWLTATLQ